MFFCFCIIIAGNILLEKLGKPYMLITTSITQFLAFLIPSLFVFFTMDKKTIIKIPFSTKPLKSRNIRLSVYLGIIICLLSFLLNVIFLYMSSQDISCTNPYGINSRDIVQNPFGYLMAFVIIPSLGSEIYVRGIIFSIFSKYADTKSSIVFSSIVFAMLHSSLYNFFGYFISGLIFAWLTYIFNSIWFSIIANIVNNITYLLIIWITDTYSGFGILTIPYTCFFILLILLYIALSIMEKLLLFGRIPRFKKSFRTTKQSFFILAINPASIIFIFAFFAKNVFKII